MHNVNKNKHQNKCNGFKSNQKGAVAFRHNQTENQIKNSFLISISFSDRSLKRSGNRTAFVTVWVM